MFGCSLIDLTVLNEPDLLQLPPLSPMAGHELLAHQLRATSASSPQRRVTIVMTGPLTNLAAALVADPSLVDVIEEVVWMGGAFGVPGI